MASMQGTHNTANTGLPAQMCLALSHNCSAWTPAGGHHGQADYGSASNNKTLTNLCHAGTRPEPPDIVVRVDGHHQFHASFQLQDLNDTSSHPVRTSEVPLADQTCRAQGRCHGQMSGKAAWQFMHACPLKRLADLIISIDLGYRFAAPAACVCPCSSCRRWLSASIASSSCSGPCTYHHEGGVTLDPTP